MYSKRSLCGQDNKSSLVKLLALIPSDQDWWNPENPQSVDNLKIGQDQTLGQLQSPTGGDIKGEHCATISTSSTDLKGLLISTGAQVLR